MPLIDQNPQQRGRDEIALEYHSAVMGISHGLVLAFKELCETEQDFAPRVQTLISEAVAKGIYDGACMMKKDELDLSNAVKDGVFAAASSIGVVATGLLIVWQALRWFGSAFGLH